MLWPSLLVIFLSLRLRHDQHRPAMLASQLMRHRLACGGLDDRENSAAWATENDHQRVGFLGQLGNDIAWSSACSVVSPMRVEFVKQRPSCDPAFGQSLIELLLPVPSVGIYGEVVDVCDVYDMHMSVQTLRHDDGEPKRGGTVRLQVPTKYHLRRTGGRGIRLGRCGRIIAHHRYLQIGCCS